MNLLQARPLMADAFAPFGDILDLPAGPGRVFFDARLVNLRPVAARPSLSLARIAATQARPIPLAKAERHPFSARAFIPLAPDFRYLVGVMPKGAGGVPDTTALCVFLAAPGQAIAYRADVWHLPMQVVDGEGRFAIVMFNDGTASDTEFADLPPGMAAHI